MPIPCIPLVISQSAAPDWLVPHAVQGEAVALALAMLAGVKHAIFGLRANASILG